MNTDDLQRWLGEEPDRLPVPGAVPVQAVIDRARAVRARRRSTLTAAVAAVAVLGVAGPIVAAGPWRDSPAVGGGVSTTVDLPRVDAHGATVFSGTVGGKHWSVRVGAGACSSPEGEIDGCGDQFDQTNPAEFRGSFESAKDAPMKYGVWMRSDVVRMTVDLADSEQLTLTATKVGKMMGAVFQVPARVGIARVTAYAADGHLVGYTIPYQSPTDAMFAQWYSPGQAPTQPEADGTIHGTIKTGPVAVEVHTGPFGICYTIRRSFGDGPLIPVTGCRPLPEAGPLPFTTDDRGIGSAVPLWQPLGGLVNNSVDHVDFALDIGTFRAPVVHIGGFSFAVCFIDLGDHGFSVISQTSYDASGRVLAYDPAPTKP